MQIATDSKIDMEKLVAKQGEVIRIILDSWSFEKFAADLLWSAAKLVWCL